MKKIDLICIQCPIGCSLNVTLENDIVSKVEGNTCKRGEIYAKKEVVNPTRTVTSTIKVEGGIIERLPVKTKEDIPKDKIFECVQALKNLCVKSPVSIGDVVLKNVASTGVDVIATKNI